MADDLKKRTFLREFLPIWISYSRGDINTVDFPIPGRQVKRNQRYSSWEWQINFIPLILWVLIGLGITYLI